MMYPTAPVLAAGEYRPLSGLRAVEVAGHVAGAYAGRILAQLGMDVTRVDLPMVAYAQPGAEDAFGSALARGKRTIAPTDPELARLINDCDVAIFDSLIDDRSDGSVRDMSRSFRRQVRGLALEISDFGVDPPYAHRPGSAVAAQAWAAMTWATGAPGRMPLSMPGDLSDFITGAQAAAAAIAGLLARAIGDTVEVASADVMGYITTMIVNNFIPYGRPWQRDGARATGSGGSYPGAIFQSLDGPIMIMCRQPSEWHGLLAAMGSPAWADSPTFADPREVARVSADEADAHLIPWIRTKTRDELKALGSRFGFPTAAVRSVSEAIEDPQFDFRGFFDEDGVPGAPWRVRQPAASGVPSVPEGERPLSGLRVLDLSWVWSGPMVTSILADLGAEVIKVESASRPDAARARGAARSKGEALEGPTLELSPYFNQLGHDKLSVEVDLRSEQGKAIVRALAEQCDVVVENMRPGVLERLGLGYDDLRAVNPRIAMLSMSMFGQEGPSRSIMGYGMVMSGLAGLESLVGYDDETMGMFNLAISDPIAGSHAIAALLAAIYRQRVDGQGCWIDLSQTECTMAVLLEQVLEARSTGTTVVPTNSHPSFPVHGVYRTAGEDSWVAVAARTTSEALRLRALVGADDTRGIEEQLKEWIAHLPSHLAADRLHEIGVSASPVQSFEELLESGWFTNRGFARVLDHPWLGPRLISAAPWRIRGDVLRPYRASPLLGEHTRTVLTDVLGMDATRVDELLEQGVIAAAIDAEPNKDGVSR